MFFVSREVMQIDCWKHIQVVHHVIQQATPFEFVWIANCHFDVFLLDDQFHNTFDVTWQKFLSVLFSVCVQFEHFQFQVLGDVFVRMRC